MVNPVTTYLLAALVAWTGVPLFPSSSASASWSRWHDGEAPTASLDRYLDIAYDVANSGALPGEALLLAAIAFEESGLRLRVDDGSCNRDRRWKWCDGGRAWSVFQYQPLTNALPEPATRAEAAVAALGLLRAHTSRAWTTGERATRRAGAWAQAHPLSTDLPEE